MHLMGVDEAGRGPLAGPVVAAAVVFAPGARLPAGLGDSKALSQKKRAALEILIKRDAVRWALGVASVEEIDQLNILQASMLAMRRAIAGCGGLNVLAMIDGPHCPRAGVAELAFVRGDSFVPQISAASILAKEARDREMRRLAVIYPGYGLEIHMGYPTQMHRDALSKLGVTGIHRKTFGPVKALLAP